MKKQFLTFVGSILLSASVFGQTKGLIISEILTNPSGNDSPFEYVELVATTNINFATTPYSVVFTDNGTATSNGWKQGGAISYGFTVTSGSVVAGQVVYIGGSSMLPLSNGGIALKTKNTGTNGGDSFGNSNTAGVLGQGGSNADGVAVFNITASSITSSSVPVDAIFFGTAIGSAFKTSGSGYQLPINDRYNGGKLLSNSFIAPDPASDQLIKATGVFDAGTNTFTTARTWTLTSTVTYNTSSVSISTGISNVAPTLAFNTTASKYVDLASGNVSCVIGSTTDPVIVSGLDINVGDEDLSTVTFTMTSSKTSVVPNANFTVSGTGSARKFKINPTGVGFATITLKVTDNGGLNKSISFNLAVSTSIATGATQDIYHTGASDGSTAIPVDANYMFVADDENNVIRLYNRNASGLPVYSFDVSSYLATTGTEVDIEGSFRSTTNPNRIYWIGSLSNNKSGNLRPDRDRIFATDIVGTGANATLSFVGYYVGLRAKLITWGDAKGYNFTAKAADGIEPKRIDGFNVEGLEIGPDNTTLYIGFRAPYVGTGTNKALIAPIANFETWFGNGSPSAAPSIGNPIELDLGNHGIRSICKNANNNYVIVAGSYAATGTFALYQWNGQAASTPTLLTANLTNLAPEGIVEIPSTLVSSFSIQLLSDFGGSLIPYNDAIVDKDITTTNFQVGVSSTLTVTGGSARMAYSENLISESTENISPNPFASEIAINIGDNTFNDSKLIIIYNTNGNIVYKSNVNALNGVFKINLENLNNGIYLVKIEGSKNTFKIIKL